MSGSSVVVSSEFPKGPLDSLFQQGKKLEDVFTVDPNSVLGSGANGVVKIVKNRTTKKDFALKTLIVGDAKALSYARAKVNAYLYLATSGDGMGYTEYFPELVAVFEEGNRVHMVMEKCEGDLATMIENGGVDKSDKKNIADALNEAISELHRKEIAHRDIKPENFLLCGGKVKLMDFGFAAPLTDEPMEGFRGTLPYMSPEIFVPGRKYNGQDIDRWALAMTNFALVTGQTFITPDQDLVGTWRTLAAGTRFTEASLQKWLRRSDCNFDEGNILEEVFETLNNHREILMKWTRVKPRETHGIKQKDPMGEFLKLMTWCI